MKKLTAAFATALVFGATSVALANDHSQPGTPGDANCKGQSIAYLNAAAKAGEFGEAVRGLGGLSDATGLTVKEIQAIVDAYCSQ